MALLSRIWHTQLEPVATEGGLRWKHAADADPGYLAQITWKDSTPWREANLWARHQLAERKSRETITSGMTALLCYANWLESVDTTWLTFPDLECDRCLTRFRGYLTKERDELRLASSTVSARMTAVVRFYRWLLSQNLIQPDNPMWMDRVFSIRIESSFGISRSLLVTSTNLSIPNKPVHLEAAEDGLVPVAVHDWRAIIEFAREHASPELVLLLQLGFSTGMRIGTLLDLKTQTIRRACPHPSMKGWYQIAIGPAASPPVHTKRDRTGTIFICSSAISAVSSYLDSERRLLRKAAAKDPLSDHVFLSRFGGKYGNKEGESRAFIVELSRLRKKALQAGVEAFRGFHFHQTRATFGTELARLALKHGGERLALWIVKKALLHKNESDTRTYVRFVQSEAAYLEASDEFSKEFFGFVEMQDANHSST